MLVSHRDESLRSHHFNGRGQRLVGSVQPVGWSQRRFERRPTLLRNRSLLAVSVPLWQILFRERHLRRFTTEAERHREGELREEVDGASRPFCQSFHPHERPRRKRNNYLEQGDGPAPLIERVDPVFCEANNAAG